MFNYYNHHYNSRSFESFFLVGQTPFPTHLIYFFLPFFFEPFPLAPFELLLFSDRPLSDVPDHARSWVTPAHQHHRLPRQEVCNQFSNQTKLNLPGFSWQSQRKAELQLTWATIQCLTQSQHSGFPKLSTTKIPSYISYNIFFRSVNGKNGAFSYTAGAQLRNGDNEKGLA